MPHQPHAFRDPTGPVSFGEPSSVTPGRPPPSFSAATLSAKRPFRLDNWSVSWVAGARASRPHAIRSSALQCRPPPSSLPTVRRAALALLPPSRGPGRAAGPPRPCRGAMLRQEKARPQGAAPPLACLGSAHLEPAPPASRPGPVGGDILPFLSSPAGTAAARASTPVGWPEGRWSPCAGCTCCHVAEPPAARGGHWPLARERGPLLQAQRALKVRCEL